MVTPFEALANLDRLIHEPARFAILTALTECRSADFVYLQSLIGVSNGNLSQHLAKLQAAGLIDIDKTIHRQKPRTMIRLNKAGRVAVEQHWRQLEHTRREAARWGRRTRRALAEE